MKKTTLAVFLAVLVYLPELHMAGAQQAPWRPTVMTMRGMVASGHPLASEAGLRILKEGGNAVDAAIGAWLVQGQVEPAMTGLGGDMYILIYLAKTGEVKFINGTGPAPMAATLDFYRSKGGMPADGPLSVEVPGAVSGALLAMQKYGSKRAAEVFAPAIEIAEQFRRVGIARPGCELVRGQADGCEAAIAIRESDRQIVPSGRSSQRDVCLAVSIEIARQRLCVRIGSPGCEILVADIGY